MLLLRIHISLLLSLTVYSSKVFTSVAKMRTLAGQERRLIDSLTVYVDGCMMEDDGRQFGEYSVPLRRFIQRSSAACSQAEYDQHYVENPINSYHTLRRLVNDWNIVINYVSYNGGIPASAFIKTATNVTSSAFWPDSDDLRGSMVALGRLADTYDLDLVEMSRGQIKDTVTSPLTVRDLVTIGDACNQAYMPVDAVGFYNVAVEILLTSDRSDVLDDPCSSDVALLTSEKRELLTPYVVYNRIIGVYRQFRAITLALKTIYLASRLDIDDNLLENLNTLSAELNAIIPQSEEMPFVRAECQYHNKTYDNLLEELNSLSDELNAIPRSDEVPFVRPECHYHNTTCEQYTQLCRHPVVRDDLYCEYRDTLNPLYKAKAEYLNRYPDVIQYHDVILDSEIEYMKQESFNLLHRSLGFQSNGGSKATRTRISESAWLDERIHTKLKKLAHRIHVITGLDVSVADYNASSEIFQLLNYGLGGMYEPHYDTYYVEGRPIQEHWMGSGDRIATVVLYLSNVKYGGATVFPKLGIKADPVKGSAAFWYNLHRNGAKNLDSLHAGCPVLVGEKWLVNKWIRYNAQHQARPCALDETL